MINVNNWAVLTSVLAVFLLSSVYYSVFSAQQTAPVSSASNTPALALWKMIPLELLRSFVVTFVLAYLFVLIGNLGLLSAVAVALLLWVGFPIVLLTGSVLHENVPWRLAALHSGDWLVKLVVIAAILNVWR